MHLNLPHITEKTRSKERASDCRQTLYKIHAIWYNRYRKAGVFDVPKKDKSKQTQIQMLCIEDMVPQDHMLREIESAIDWNFIYDEVKGL